MARAFSRSDDSWACMLRRVNAPSTEGDASGEEVVVEWGAVVRSDAGLAVLLLLLSSDCLPIVAPTPEELLCGSFVGLVMVTGAECLFVEGLERLETLLVASWCGYGYPLFCSGEVRKSFEPGFLDAWFPIGYM